jgi:hypothetical protein
MRTAEVFTHLRTEHPDEYYQLNAATLEDWSEYESTGLVSPDIYAAVRARVKNWCPHLPALPFGTTLAIQQAVEHSGLASIGGQIGDLLDEWTAGKSWPCDRHALRALASALSINHEEVARLIFGAGPVPDTCPVSEQEPRAVRAAAPSHGSTTGDDVAAARPVRPRKKDSCPCGSGRRFRRCCAKTWNLESSPGATAASSPGSAWDGIWYAHAASYRSFVADHHRLPQFKVNDAEEVRLAYWRLNNAKALRLGTLTQGRREFLEAIPGWTWPPERDHSNRDIRDRNMAVLLNYTETHGTSLMRPGLDWDGVSLASAISGWKSRFVNGNPLSREFREQLEALPDWSWQRGPEIDDLRCLRAIERPASHHVLATTEELSRWCEDQRTGYHRGLLSDARKASLDAVEGWEWAPVTKGALPVDHPYVSSGIEALRSDQAMFSDGLRSELGRVLHRVDLVQQDIDLEEIGRLTGTSRESVRKAIRKAADMALHPLVLRSSVRFWQLWGTNYESLIMEGELSPELVGGAVSVLQQGSASFSCDELRRTRPLMWRVVQVPAQEVDERRLSRPIQPVRVDDLHLGVRASNVLRYHDIETIDQLARFSPLEILSMRNAGATTLDDIVQALAIVGRSLSSGQLPSSNACHPVTLASSAAPGELPEQPSPVADSMPVVYLQLSERTVACLKSAGIIHVGELSAWSPDALLEISNFGQVCLDEVTSVLAGLRRSLAS